MPYDLLIKNGRVVDGRGTPSYRGDIGIRGGKIAEIGRLRASAARTIDADGLVVAPGFIDNHCHYDAQVTWDPLCSYSCYHGATTVLIGNCSLALAPVRRGQEERLAEFLCQVEAIPMETLRTVEMPWESVAEYMDALDRRLGVNVGVLIGHTAVRHYVMGRESQGRAATPAEIESMRGVVRDAMFAGALGLSINTNKGHYDPQGEHIPAYWADGDELFALGNVLGELGVGVIQAGGGREAEFGSRLMTRLAETTGCTVLYNAISQTVRSPDGWRKHLALAEDAVRRGIRAYPMCSSKSSILRFTMRNTQEFRSVPTWHPILSAPDDEKLRAYSDPEVRRKLHQEVVEWSVDIPGNTLTRGWIDYMWVGKTKLAKNEHLEGKSLRELAQATDKGIIDAMMDLVVEENLDTVFLRGAGNTDREAMTRILNSPYTFIGLSDGGAHVQFSSGYGFSTRLLGYWVREQNIMSLEKAVQRLTFDNASAFGIYDRGLLRPGLAADLVIFDPDTVRPLPEEVVHDLPAGAWRMKELAAGIHYTIVNGQVLLESGRHSGALPGRIIRNWLYRERAAAAAA